MDTVKKVEASPLETLDTLRDQVIRLLDHDCSNTASKLKYKMAGLQKELEELKVKKKEAEQEVEDLKEKLEAAEENADRLVDPTDLKPILELAYRQDPKLYEYYWRSAGVDPQLAEVHLLDDDRYSTKKGEEYVTVNRTGTG